MYFFILLIFLTSINVFAQNNSQTYCFDKTVSLKSVKNELDLILLPSDTVDFNERENCLQINVGMGREVLFEKFLSQKHNLIQAESGALETKEKKNCVVGVKRLQESSKEEGQLRIGNKDDLSKTESSQKHSSEMEFLITEGLAGEMEVGTEKLKVVCRLLENNKANIVFSYAENNKSNINSELVIKKNEWMSLGSVIIDLHDKIKKLGLPEVHIADTSTQASTTYEIQLK